jgi:hypothetical protein
MARLFSYAILTSIYYYHLILVLSLVSQYLYLIKELIELGVFMESNSNLPIDVLSPLIEVPTTFLSCIEGIHPMFSV